MSSLASRLRARVVKAGRCLIWTGSKYHDGYGKMSWKGKTDRVHRLSWKRRGTIPTGLQVLHTCDTPLCIRRSHVFLGNHQDNMDDMNRKGRHARIVTRGNRTLTDAEVTAVRAAKGRQVDIAARFGINQAAVSKIKTRRTWKHIP